MTTKPRRKATPKVPAKPTPIEATQVLAYRGQLGEMGAETNHRDTLDLISNMVPLVLAAAVGEEVAKAARLRAYSIVDELAKRPPRGLKKRAKCALLEGELAAEEKVVAVWLQVEEWHAEPGGAPVPMGDRDWASVEYDRLAKGAASGWSEPDGAWSGDVPAEPVGAGWSGGQDSAGDPGGWS